MRLVLQIENFDRLADGGPIAMPVDRPSCQVGRNSSMDWVLPDPSRMISGHHFDVSFADGAWWLTDRSTNGTFLLGSPYRLSQPHRLSHLDRLQVGKYIIVALLEGAAQAIPPQPDSAQPAFPPAPMPDAWQAEPEDPWAVGPALPPVEVHRPAAVRRLNDFADDFIPTPVAAPTPFPAAPFPAAPPDHDPGHDIPETAGLGHMLAPVPRPGGGFEALAPPILSPAAPSSRAASPPLAPAAAGTSPHPAAGLPGDFVAAFCAAAGLDPKLAEGLEPAAFGQLLGEIMRGATDETMSQLKLRAAARKFTRSNDQTMRQASANNPLKFLPGPEQALEAILFRPRAGFLSGAAAVSGALGDLRRHQVAIFAALQPALARLLEDLSPDAIMAASSGKGFLAGARKQRAWDSYVEAWDARAHPHENGMLDAFLQLFAEAYEQALSQQHDGTIGNADRVSP